MEASADLGSQQRLGKRCGIGQTTIGRIRRGEVNATVDNLKAIADAFGVTVGYLCGEGGIEERRWRWPFSFDQDSYERLSARQKEKIEAYIQGLLDSSTGDQGNQAATR